ncbi:low temperature requirement protein A [Micromonospora sp. SD19]
MGLLRRGGSGQQATFVELFFDLAVVFALNRLVAQSLPALLAAGAVPRWGALVRTLLLFVAVMWLWTTTAFITARFEPRHAGTQVMLVGSAFAMIVMGAAVVDVAGDGGVVFAVAFVATQVLRTGVLAAGLRSHRLRRLYGRTLVWFGLAGVPWLLGGLTDGLTQLTWWTVAVVLDLGSARLGWPVPGLGRGRTTTWQVAGGHLADRYAQLLMIALGESVLAVGISYSTHPWRAYESAGLVVAFATTVLLWRVYFFKSGQLLPEALTACADPAGWGRRVGFAHAVMVFGIVIAAIGQDIVQYAHTAGTRWSWLVAIVGGPALFMAGRARLEQLVFSRVARRRIVAIALLIAATPLLRPLPPLATAATAAVVLLFIAVLDWRQATGRPPESASPPC